MHVGGYIKGTADGRSPLYSDLWCVQRPCTRICQPPSPPSGWGMVPGKNPLFRKAGPRTKGLVQAPDIRKPRVLPGTRAAHNT